MSPRRILLVEDDERDLELTLAALNNCNLSGEVDVTRDGPEALDYLFRRGSYSSRPNANPALVLLDLKLPKMDGTEVLKAIRQQQETHMTPVVMFTSSHEDRDLRRSYELGASAYVVKPFDLARFMEVIKGIGAFWCGVNEPPPDSVAKID
jgi:CheY-like chemotaxis protein